jgi:hypothetical protein
MTKESVNEREGRLIEIIGNMMKIIYYYDIMTILFSYAHTEY